MSDDIVVVDNGSTYETQESAIVAKNEADRAEQWAKYSEEKANLADERAVDAAESSDAAAQAATAAIEAKQYAETAITDENLIVVATDLKSTPSNIKKTAGSIDNVNTVSNDIENINAVAANKVNIDKVAADKDNIDTVATNIVNVNTVAKNIDNVNLLAPHTEAMEALAPDIMDVVTVAGITEQTKNVSDNMAHVVAVDNNKTNIDKAVANEANITTVATNINDVNTVAKNINSVTAVADNEKNINAVNANATNINAVAANKANIDAVNANKVNIDNVALNKTNINTVSTNIAAVNNVSENMADVKNAVQSANDAKLWAVGTKTEKPEGSSKYWAEQAQQAAQVYDASETVKGIVRLSTSEEAESGLDDTTAITPLKLKQNIVKNVGRVNQLGFNGTLAGGVITFTPDQGTYELKAGYEYEIDLLFSAVGTIPDDTQLKIVNGTDTINIVNVLDSDYSKPTTYKAMKQVCRYDTEIGWRWIFNVRYSVASDGSKVFVMPSTATNVDTTDIYNKINTKQDISTAVNYNNITNCITEIPQDIKLELNNGTLTLKAGSKVYIPNGKNSDGSKKFNVHIVASDKVISYGSIFSGLVLAINSANDSFLARISYTTGSDTSSRNIIYDTSNNLVKTNTPGTSNWTSGLSFPIAIINCIETNKFTIDRIFNGLGYIGSTVYALPGVKGLIPNGRNADGSLRNIELTLDKVLTETFPDLDVPVYVTLKTNSLDYWQVAVTPIGYDEAENIFINGNNIKSNETILGISYLSNGRIVSFTPKTVFHALDYNDKSTISSWSLPSKNTIQLTVGSSGRAYNAPANGYFIFSFKGSLTYMRIWNDTLSYGSIIFGVVVPKVDGYCSAFLPVAEGQKVYVYYDNSYTWGAGFFVFAEGESYNKVKDSGGDDGFDDSDL